MTKNRFPEYDAGQEIVIDPTKNDLHMACCDCNLVHIIQFEITTDKKLSIRMWRDNRKTAALRRYRGVSDKLSRHLTKRAADVGDRPVKPAAD